MSSCCSMCVLLWYLLFYMCIVFVFVVLCVNCSMCVAGFTVDAELLARSQYSEGPATGHLDTGFLGFPVSIKKC